MKASLKFGLVTTNQAWLEDDFAALDASGFGALYVVDHPAFPNADPWTWLAFAAARTHRVRLGTHVTGAPFHHPTALARQVASVDRLSNGRAVLGIGAAYERADFEPFGFEMLPFGERLEALRETICILRSLWTEETSSFSGTHFTLSGGAEFGNKPVQQPHPPIVIGLNRAGAALQLAVECADAINTWQLGAEQVASMKPEIEVACERFDRDPSTLKITSDVLLARGACRADAGKLAGSLRDLARSWGRSRSVTEWNADGILYGDADEMAEQACRFADAGVSELSVAIHDVDELVWFDENVIAPFAEAA